MVAIAVQPPAQFVQHIAGAPDNNVVATIDQTAVAVGVPTSLAEAMAKVESGFNPAAVGDNGSSFGLYQLHRGGMLGSLTPTQAFDPATNARVALTHLAAVMQLHPGQDPGVSAAQSQRPADQAGYAAKVDAALGANASGDLTAYIPGTHIHIPGTGSGSNVTPGWVPTPGDVGGAVVSGAADAAKSVLGWIAKPLENVALIGLGIVVFIVGLVVLAHASDNNGGGGGGQRRPIIQLPGRSGGGGGAGEDVEAAAG